MIKFQIISLNNNLDLAKVPSGFRGFLSINQLGKTIISFKTDRNDVVMSRELKKILSKLDLINNKYLILTANLTEESAKILDEAGIEYITTSNFIWTDESYQSIK